MRNSSNCVGALLLCVVAGSSLVGSAQPQPEIEAVPRLGLTVDAVDVARLPVVADDGAPTIVRLSLDWGRVEEEPGVYDWSAYDSAVERLAKSGYEIVLDLKGTNLAYLSAGRLPSPLIGESLVAWVAWVRAAVQRFGARVAVFQVGDSIGRDDSLDPTLEALGIKQAALAVRAEAEAGQWPFRVAQPATTIATYERQRALWERDLAAYVDVVPLNLEGGPPSRGDALRRVLTDSLSYPPASEVWVYLEAGEDWEGVRHAVEALAGGASVALVEAQRDRLEVQATWVNSLNRLLAAGFAPSPIGGLSLDLDGAAVLGRFFDQIGFETLVVYHAPGKSGQDPARLHVDAAVVREARTFDPTSGETLRLPSGKDPAGGRVIRVPRGSAPGIVIFRQAAAGEDRNLPPEAIAIASARGLTAEEIIARYQVVEREQKNRLERFTAKGRVDYHFRLSEGGETVDVSIDSQYFWERGGELEWEQLEYYFNGNRVRWKKFPKIPLIQPEKVITLPLDLTLNKTYTYRLVGEEKVDGADTYTLDFRPVDPDAALSLYRGRVWIDKQTFVRRKLRLIQGNLEPPVISNEEVDHFQDWTGPAGDSFSLFSRIDGQQVWNVAGRTFVVQRELTFRDLRINPPLGEFEARRRQAYESKNTMMRDTSGGFRYLERTDEGDRVVKERVASSTLFLGAGAFKDGSQENVVPLVAVNYFDYDVGGKNIQANVLFAGVFAFGTISNPDLFDGRMDLTLDAGLSALKFGDKFFVGEEELVEERLDIRPNRIALRLGFPFGDFFKLNFVGGVSSWEYALSDSSAEAIDRFNGNPGTTEQLEFVVPPDHFDLTATLEARFNRRGYTVVARASGAWRSDWDEWGLLDAGTGEYGSVNPVSGAFVPVEPEPAYDRYARWGVTAFKEWFLSSMQKVRGEVSYLDGEDLDRFSRYQFSYFGNDRLNGFSGSGVRFDQGFVGRAGYSFNLLEAIRFSLNLDAARVEDLRTAVGPQDFAGIGINGNFPAPWRTVIDLGYGYSISSDIPDLAGNHEFLLLILKLF